MKIQRPLINPVPEDFIEKDYEKLDESGANIDYKNQLKLSVKEPAKIESGIASLRYRIKRRTEELEISMIWKSLAIPFAIVSTIFNFILVVGGSIVLFNKISPTIPFTYDYINSKAVDADKSVIFIFSIILLTIEILVINLAIKIFRTDRRLALAICWILGYLNIMLLISTVQIIGMIKTL